MMADILSYKLSGSLYQQPTIISLSALDQLLTLAVFFVPKKNFE